MAIMVKVTEERLVSKKEAECVDGYISLNNKKINVGIISRKLRCALLIQIQKPSLDD